MAVPGVLIVIPAYNEGERLLLTLHRLKGTICAKSFREAFDPSVLVVDDGSGDGAPEEARGKYGDLRLERHESNLGQRGILRTLRSVLRTGPFDYVLTLAGNNKDNPAEMIRLLSPLACGEADVVQGSRYLRGFRGVNMPLYRILATRVLHPTLVSLATGRRLTDSTNGFKAYRRDVLLDPRIDTDLDWLKAYSIEPFLLIRAAQLGWRIREVPVSKVYPPRAERYTKMQPVVDWWGILKPALRLALGLSTRNPKRESSPRAGGPRTQDFGCSQVRGRE
ncbi:MAG: glycosyltransferase family 2 protein [Planctomycetota bacterium]